MSVEIQDYLRILRKRWIVVAVVTIVGAVAAFGISILVKPTYQSSTSMFVSTPAASDSATDLVAGSTFGQQRVQSYATAVTTARVLSPVIRTLRLDTTVDDLAKQIEAAPVTNTAILNITVSDHSAVTAATIANAIAATLPNVVSQIENTGSRNSSGIKVSVLQAATVSPDPASPNLKLNVALGLVVGLALGFGLAVLFETLDTRIRRVADVEALTDATVVGTTVEDPDIEAHRVIVADDPLNVQAEAYRVMRTNVQFVTLDVGMTFVITSALAGEGKSTTSANLAASFAKAGQRTLLVEADLRASTMSKYLGVIGAVGLTDILLGDYDLEDGIQEWGDDGLNVLPGGSIPPNPSELLGSARMRTLVSDLRERYDVLIFDCPPALPVTDAVVLAKLVGGAFLVVAAGKSHKNEFLAASRALENVDVPLLGVLLTMVPSKGGDGYGYGSYRYGYGTYGRGPVEGKSSHGAGSGQVSSGHGRPVSGGELDAHDSDTVSTK